MSVTRVDNLSNVAGTKSVATGDLVDGHCTAWVNFNGTSTVAIRDSFNVSSITDLGTGQYTVNFTNSMTNANYSVASNGSRTATDYVSSSWIANATLSVDSVNIYNAVCHASAFSMIDPTYLCVQIFGGL